MPRPGFEPDHAQPTPPLASRHADTQLAEAATFLNPALKPRLQPPSLDLATRGRPRLSQPAGVAPDLAFQHQLRETGGQVACSKLETSKSPFLRLLSFLFGSFLPLFFS